MMIDDYFHHYKLNIQTIDDDHYILLEFFDKIKKSVKDRDKTIDLLDQFQSLTLIHFKNEEDFMLKINYPYREYHCLVHKNIMESLNEIISDLNKYKNFNQNYLITTLRKCLLTHIDEFDRQISVFLKLSI